MATDASVAVGGVALFCKGVGQADCGLLWALCVTNPWCVALTRAKKPETLAGSPVLLYLAAAQGIRRASATPDSMDVCACGGVGVRAWSVWCQHLPCRRAAASPAPGATVGARDTCTCVVHIYTWLILYNYVYMYMYASYILGWHALLTARRSALSTPLSTAFSTICAVGGTYMRKCAAWMWERMHAC